MAVGGLLLLLLSSLTPLYSQETAHIVTECGTFSMAMWSLTPFSDTLHYSLDGTIITLNPDIRLLPLSSLPNSTAPSSLLLLDFSQVTPNAVWNFGKLSSVVSYYYEGGNYSGVLVRDFGISPGVFNQYPWQANDFEYPVGLMGYDDFAFLVHRKECRFNVTFGSVGNFDNPWKNFVNSGGFAVLQCILILFIVNLGLAVLRLKDMWKQVSIGSICLYCEVAGNTIFILKFLTNLAYAYMDYYDENLIIASELFSTIPVPFFLTASLLFVFFWLDITSTSNYLYGGKLLGIMKIPCIICITLLFSLEFTSDILRFTVESSYSSNLDLSVSLFYGIVIILVILINSLAFYKVLHQTNQRITRIHSVFPKVAINILILVLSVILVLAGSFAGRNIVGFYFRKEFLFLGLSLQSMNQIFVFRSKPHQHHSYSLSQTHIDTSSTQTQHKNQEELPTTNVS